ncbi:hypothetical protein APECO1_29 [Escherichia coli APEC O1]|uniref:Uncharacterized protein n=1 Tax=Escherichia coli O1:K1 / APEC TaxID=405955 RepID=A0A0H2YXR3_ECOK1|nr:hypothetical protein APECO1_29 [Escherichia coli APEC O1]
MNNHGFAVNINQWFTGQTRGRVTRGNNDHKTHDLLSSAVSTRASVSSNTGMPSRSGKARLSSLQISSCFSWLYQSFPLQTGQAMISSRR